MRQRVRAALAVFAALLLAGCEEERFGPIEPGELQLVFSGDTAGEYHARGRTNALNFRDSAFAVATRGIVRGSDYLKVESQHLHARPLRDIVELAVHDPARGTTTCAEGAECRFAMAIALGTTRDDGGDAAGLFRSVGGTLHVTRLERRRARGTFVVELVESGTEAPRRIRVEGSFDVYVLTA
jgi:hypothetical protein